MDSSITVYKDVTICPDNQIDQTTEKAKKNECVFHSYQICGLDCLMCIMGLSHVHNGLFNTSFNHIIDNTKADQK